MWKKALNPSYFQVKNKSHKDREKQLVNIVNRFKWNEKKAR